MNEEIITLGDIEIKARKSPKAKRITLKSTSYNGIELIIPKRVSFKKATEFLLSKELWIKKQHLELKNTPKVPFKEGSIIPILGNNYEISYSGKLRGITHIKDNKIIISGDENNLGAKLIKFLKNAAKTEIKKLSELYAKELGVNFKSISVKDTKTRWGSCSARGNLSFSWRLIFAPKYVLDYVVAHEIAHLIEMNHSKDFWKIVELIYPEHQKARAWLKENGSSLLLFG